MYQDQRQQRLVNQWFKIRDNRDKYINVSRSETTETNRTMYQDQRQYKLIDKFIKIRDNRD